MDRLSVIKRDTVLVSAVIATWNDAKYLPESIGSVLAQQYGSLECIVVDDGSSDDTPHIVKRWAQDSRFQYLRSEHVGLSHARNLGLKVARGDFVAFLDADDWWRPEKTHRQVEFLLTHPELGFCWCDMEKVGHLGGKKEIIIRNKGESTSLAEQILLEGIPAPPSCWMVRRSLLDKVGGFAEEIYYGSDVELIFRLACQAKGGRVGEVLTTKRCRPDSMSMDVRNKSLLGPMVVEKMLNYDRKRFSRYRSLVMHNLHRYLAGHSWRGRAFSWAIYETILAAGWKFSYVFEREFWNNVIVSHLLRLFGRIINNRK